MPTTPDSATGQNLPPCATYIPDAEAPGGATRRATADARFRPLAAVPWPTDEAYLTGSSF